VPPRTRPGPPGPRHEALSLNVSSPAAGDRGQGRRPSGAIGGGWRRGAPGAAPTPRLPPGSPRLPPAPPVKNASPATPCALPATQKCRAGAKRGLPRIELGTSPKLEGGREEKSPPLLLLSSSLSSSSSPRGGEGRPRGPSEHVRPTLPTPLSAPPAPAAPRPWGVTRAAGGRTTTFLPEVLPSGRKWACSGTRRDDDLRVGSRSRRDSGAIPASTRCVGWIPPADSIAATPSRAPPGHVAAILVQGRGPRPAPRRRSDGGPPRDSDGSVT